MTPAWAYPRAPPLPRARATRLPGVTTSTLRLVGHRGGQVYSRMSSGSAHGRLDTVRLAADGDFSAQRRRGRLALGQLVPGEVPARGPLVRAPAGRRGPPTGTLRGHDQ